MAAPEEEPNIYQIPTYEYRCSSEYAGRDVIQPMFIVEKKTEKTKEKSATPEEIAVCSACSEICYNRSDAKPIVCYREMTCQCGCKKETHFDKERKELTLDILKHDGLVGIHAALLSSIVSSRDALERARTFPVQDSSDLDDLATQLGRSDDVSDMIRRASVIDTQRTGSVEMAGRVASAFLARNIRARIVVTIPLSSKPVSASNCKWQTQVYNPVSRLWEDVGPTAAAAADPKKVTVTVAFNENGFVTALDVAALSAEVAAVFVRKLLEYDCLRRDIHEDLRRDFSTSPSSLALLNTAMGKAVTRYLTARETETVMKELVDVHHRVNVERIKGGEDPGILERELLAIEAMYNEDNESCEALSRLLAAWNDCDVATAVEYLQHVIEKWEGKGSDVLVSRMNNDEIARGFEAILSRISHRATAAQLGVLEIMRRLYDKHTRTLLLTTAAWERLLRVLAQAAERRGITWSEPVVYLAGYVVRTAIRAMYALRESIRKEDCANPAIHAIRALRCIAELRDPSTIVSLVESVKLLFRDFFDGCFPVLAKELLPVLEELPHQTADLPDIIAALRRIEAQH